MPASGITISTDTIFTYSISTLDPSTGVVADADAAPAYRLYGSTGNLVANGTLSKLDDANTVGLYRVSLDFSSYTPSPNSGETWTLVISYAVSTNTVQEVMNIAFDYSGTMASLFFLVAGWSPAFDATNARWYTDVKAVNSTALQGAGANGDPWRPV